jgi:hypothetical protein
MTQFADLQAAHERLLEQSKAPQDVTAFVAEVQREMQNMCVAAEDITAPRERDQLRAILRFWASYVYDRTGTYPDTTLRPASNPPPQPPEPAETRPHFLRIFIVAAGILAALMLLLVLIVSRWPTGSLTQLPPADNQTDVSTAGAASDQPLNLQWTVITAGPSPFDKNVWVARLQLSATGGNGSYIFWLNGARLPDLSANQFTVEGAGCEPQIRVAGATSGGQATSLELTIWSPLPDCPTNESAP